MKATTLAAKFYDVNVLEGADMYDAGNAAVGEEQWELYEKGEDCEPIGYFVKLAACDCYQWRNVYGKVATGTAYTEESLKAAIKAKLFY